MYAVSFGLLGSQFLASAFNITLVNYEGTPIENNVSSMVNIDALNIRTLNVTQTSQSTITTDPIVAAASMALQLFLILTGTYVFNIMILFGVPLIFVSGFVILYLIMMIRAIIGLLRGI